MVNWTTHGSFPWSTHEGRWSQADGTRKQVQKQLPQWYVIAGQVLCIVMGRLRFLGAG